MGVRQLERINRHPRWNTGFTLIEILLVLVIAIGAISVVGPNLSRGLSGVQLKSATRGLASALRFARGEAITKVREVELLLDVEKHSYRINTQEKTYPINRDIHLELFTAQSEIENDEVGAIRFFPDGTSTGGRITLVANNRKRLIDVSWLTGRVTINYEDDG